MKLTKQTRLKIIEELYNKGKIGKDIYKTHIYLINGEDD